MSDKEAPSYPQGYSQNFTEFAPQVQERKSWFFSHWILVVVLILVIVVGVMSFNYFNGKSSIHNALPTGKLNQTKQNLSVVSSSCPDMSRMVLIGVTPSDNSTWLAYPLNYTRLNEKVIYSYASFTDDSMPQLANKSLLYCTLGTADRAQNTSKVYCGNMINVIVFDKLDAQGNVKNQTSVEVVFDAKTKSFVKTNCGTYDLSNAGDAKDYTPFNLG